MSIIIPVFNERRKIIGDIEAAAAFLTGNSMKGEIIVVDDGSQDHTSDVARAVHVADSIKLEAIRYDRHRGKGFAVRTGIEASTGAAVMFADSGRCVPYHYVLAALKMLNNRECDIAHGSRRLKQSRILLPQPWYRRAFSQLFRWLVIIMMKVPATLTDTQCGFKIYRGEVARKLYGMCVTEGFMFDVEIILRALQRDFTIKEFPIEWTADPDSRTTQTLNLKQLLTELFTIKQLLSRNK